jgi:hypothetical protein
MFLSRYFVKRKNKPPELLRFAHLFSEYQIIKDEIVEAESNEFIDKLATKNLDNPPSWDELYRFELILAKYIPYEKLRSKIIRLRYDYRSIVGQAEFDEYLAAKPPDLQSPPEPVDPKNATHAHYELLLREDLKDLLGRMYQEYAILPVREDKINQLTIRAAGLCLLMLAILLGILAVMFLGGPVYDSLRADGGWGEKLEKFRNSTGISALTVFVVVISGAMGGFVSSLRRLQTPRTEGDSLYNLSLLYHGSESLLTAPITGSIFAILLYLMFLSGLLSGSFFPTIYSPEGTYTEIRALPADANKNVNQPPSSEAATNVNAQGPTSESKTAANTQQLTLEAKTNSNTKPKTTSTPKPVPQRGIDVFEFLAKSGPGNGKDYALLIIWCFIAGFAERFVPDALDRIITANKSASLK